MNADGGIFQAVLRAESAHHGYVINKIIDSWRTLYLPTQTGLSKYIN